MTFNVIIEGEVKPMTNYYVIGNKKKYASVDGKRIDKPDIFYTGLTDQALFEMLKLQKQRKI